MSASQGGPRDGRPAGHRVVACSWRSRRRPRRNRPRRPFRARSATRRGVLPGAPGQRQGRAERLHDTRRVSGGDGTLRARRPAPRHLRDHRRRCRSTSRSRRPCRSWSARPSPPTSRSRPTCSSSSRCRWSGDLPGRDADVGDRDQRHRGADPLPAAEPRATSSTSPALAPGVRVSDNEFRKEMQRRRAVVQPDQRLHRRRQLQERRHRGRRRRPGRQPRQPVPAERRAGVPGPHPELQGGVREGRRARSSRRSPRAAATGSPARSSASTRTRTWCRTSGWSASASVSSAADRAEADLRPLPVGRVGRRPDRQGQGCSSSGPTRRTARTATTGRSLGGSDRRAAGALTRSQQYEGTVHQPVPREAALRQDCRRSRARGQQLEVTYNCATRPTSAASAASPASSRPRTSATASTRCSASGRSRRAATG